jgi:magnesium transporter
MTQEEMAYQLTESLETLLKERRLDELRLLCAAQRPADLTEALDLLDTESKQAIFRELDLELAAEVLGECDEDHQRELMAALDEARLARVLEHLPLDEAADAVSELSEDQAFRVLSRINPSESQEIQDLMQYSEDTAGGIMTPDVIAFPETMTVGELLDAFRGSWKRSDALELPLQPAKPEWENAYELIREENVYTIYVVDEDRRLKGYVRLQDLLRADPQCPLSELLNTDVISVRTGEDQENVAEMVHKYDMASIPVTDEENRLVGRITMDDVMDVMHEEETTEDMMRMAGTTEDDWSPGVRCTR